VISYEEVDSPAAQTCAAAFQREEWSVFLSNGVTKSKKGRAWVVIWSRESLNSKRLAQESCEPLLKNRLLQIFVQPRKTARESSSRKNTILPPEPFRSHQGLPVDTFTLDGSERAVDSMVTHDLDGILKAVAKIGRLKRPRDRWDARICFRKPYEGTVEPVIVSEFAAKGGHLFRREEINDENSFIDTVFETTKGNRWSVVAKRKGDLVIEVVVKKESEQVGLQRQASWWQRLRGL